MDSNQIPIVVALLLVIVAAAYDFATRTIPNSLTLGGVALGIALAASFGAVDAGVHGAVRSIGFSLLGIAVCVAVPAFSFARGEMGGGDVKLFAAIGALCGPALGFDAEAFTFAISLFVVLPWRLARSGAFAASLQNGARVVRNLVRPRSDRLPYAHVRLRPVVMGPAIALGLCLAVLRRGALP